MSTDPECIKGGVSIIWKIENYCSIQTHWLTGFNLEWPGMKSKWHLTVSVTFNDVNEKYFCLSIKKLDKIAPFILNGTISAINEKFYFKLNQFDGFNFPESKGNEYLMQVNLKTLEYTDSEQQDFINDSVTVHIKLWNPNVNDLAAKEYFVRSTYTEQMCSFQWILNGDRDWKKNGKYIQSSIDIPMEFKDFSTMETIRMTFSLLIQNDKTFASLWRNDDDLEKSYLQCSYNLKIQKKEGTYPPFLVTNWCEFCNPDKTILKKITEEEWNYLCTKWIVTIEIIVVTPFDGVLENIYYKPRLQSLKMKSRISKRNRFSKNNLQRCLLNLYKKGEHCDVVLRADNKTFPCHKTVLCARSSVFKTMLENNTIEKVTNIVNIPDIESPILDMFLIYLYSDNLVNEDVITAVKLYEMADKYAVPNLIEECYNIIISSLCTENACEMLNLADSHKDDDLKEDILSYFYEHNKEIMITSSWKELILNKPDLAAKTLQDAVTYDLKKILEKEN